MAATGMAAVGGHAWDILLSFALVLLATACGQTIIQRLDGRGMLRGESLVFGLLVGSGVVSTAVLGLGLVGLLNRFALAGVLLLLAAGARSGWIDMVARARASERVPGSNARLFVGITAVIGLFMVIESLVPAWDWDTLMYQLDVPRDYLEAGRVFLPPDNLHALYVNVVQFLYIPLLAFGGTAGPALLSTAFALSLAILLWRCGAEVFGGKAGAAASVLIWSSTMVVLVAVTPRVDVTVAALAFAAHCALWSAWRRRSVGHLRLAAILAGFAIAAKANAIPYIAGLGAIGVGVAFARRDAWRTPQAARTVAMAGILAMAVALPWYLKNVLLMASWTDVLTVGSRISPWLADLIGATRIESVPGVGGLLAHSQAREPLSLGGYFSAPSSITIEGEAAFYFAGIVLAVAPLGLLLRGSRAAVLFFLVPPVVFLALILARSPIVNARYLIPAVPALTLVGAAVLAQAARAIARRRAAALLSIVVGLLLLPTAFAGAVTTLGYKSWRNAAGLDSGAEALQRRRDVSVLDYVNENLGARSLVLMLGDAKGFLYSVPSLQDNAVTNWPILLASGLTDGCLAGTGISHVVMRPGSEEFFAQRGADVGPYRWDEFPAFADRCLVPVLEQGSHRLFRVRTDGGGQPVSSPNQSTTADVR